jgi:predicted glycosyltransferase
VLQHGATMNRGAGLTGVMAIIIADGKHSYEFDYELAEG